MVKVMVFGSFDLLHEGHRSLFRQAKRYGDELIVVVARDSSIRVIKEHNPRYGEEERLAHVRDEPIVDEAVLGDEKDFLKVVEEKVPDVIILGYDQKTFSDDELRNKLNKRGLKPEIKHAVSFKPEIYKSSLIKEKMN